MRLRHQLFLTLLLASGLPIALMAAFSSWSFDRGFLAYINDSERQRLEPLIEALAEGYAREGDWRWISGNRGAWKALLDEHLGRGKRRPDGQGRRLPPSRDTPLSGGPLSLLDAERRRLIGPPDPPDPPGAKGERRWQPIVVAERAVGYLGHRVLTAPPGQLDRVFAERQRTGFVYAALAMVLLCAVLAIALAARIVRPLLTLADAVGRIGRGQYAHRVPEARGDEIGDLSRDVNRLALALETSLTARRQWLAEISHELRTPVAVLQGELEAIQDGVSRLDRAAIDSLHSEALRLGRLIDDLHQLTMSDIGALDYRFEPLDLREVLGERLERSRSRAEEANIAVELALGAAPIEIDGDAERLAQLVDNLIQNSLRYTDAGGRLRVSLARDGALARLDWCDSAPGVDETQLPRLFDPLYRADVSRGRQSGGSGLGLAIVRRIVDAHQGRVTASASPLGGLAIRVELPLRREETS